MQKPYTRLLVNFLVKMTSIYLVFFIPDQLGHLSSQHYNLADLKEV